MGILTLFLLFVSPVGYTPEMVPENLRFALWLNPVHYLTDTFRAPLFYGRPPSLEMLRIYAPLCLAVFCLGGTLFKKTDNVRYFSHIEKLK